MVKDLMMPNRLPPECDMGNGIVPVSAFRGAWRRPPRVLRSKFDLLRGDRRALRSQNIFLNFAGRSFR